MPPVRKKRPNATLDTTRVRPKALAQAPDLTQSPKCVKMGQVVSKEKEKALHAATKPDTDMIGPVEVVEKIPQPSSHPHDIGESSKLSEKATPNSASMKESQPQAATKADCSPKPRPIIEAEQRRAAISGVKATIPPLTNGSNR
ncbi:EKA-like protein [Blumeria hordei DH14]|uniref:EKA-like protein n=1 Tax=Blumeria graminis f. sp. hordei (strain DH14) TaxID=546991 RepID=N1J8G8_BLUG1|nr:EKA-like protein [Blumeria hordei DH14]